MPNCLFAESLCRVADEAIIQASAIRGLKQKRRVPCLIQGKEEVEKYLVSAIKEKVPPERLRWEGRTYKALGFIPESFDYERGLVELYVSQLGGYYEPTTAHYVMAGWMPEQLQAPIAVHELTHALQDQYFDLKKFTDDKKFTSDELMARSAVVEGDATAVMMDYSRGLAGQPPIAKDPDVNSIMLQNVVGGAVMVAATGAPQSLQSLLLFPYTSGLRFIHAILRKSGYGGINKAMRNPPRSTEEILHPEKFGAAAPDFVNISAEELKAEAGLGGEILFADVFGEFGVSALLAAHDKNRAKTAQAAAGWGGDRAVVIKTPAGSEVLIWKIIWDSPKDLSEFREAITRVLAERFPLVDLAPVSWSKLREDRKVSLVEGSNYMAVVYRF